jgi:hypothetical protein
MTKTFLVYLREIIKKRGEDQKNKKMCVCVRERERETDVRGTLVNVSL